MSRHYVDSGLDQGRLNDFTGVGLIQSLGGCSEVRKYGLRGQEHIKSDERILGESDFVSDVLSSDDDRKYELKRRGYDLDRIAVRVAEIYEIGVDDIYLKVFTILIVSEYLSTLYSPDNNVMYHTRGVQSG